MLSTFTSTNKQHAIRLAQEVSCNTAMLSVDQTCHCGKVPLEKLMRKLRFRVSRR